MRGIIGDGAGGYQGNDADGHQDNEGKAQGNVIHDGAGDDDAGSGTPESGVVFVDLQNQMDELHIVNG